MACVDPDCPAVGLGVNTSVGCSVADLILEMVPHAQRQLELGLKGKSFIIARSLVNDKTLSKHDIRVEFRFGVCVEFRCKVCVQFRCEVCVEFRCEVCVEFRCEECVEFRC